MKKIAEKRKIPGVSYAFTANGIELPVLDITHAGFMQSIDEEKLVKMLGEMRRKGQERAERFNAMPSWLKNYLARHSFIMAGFLNKDSGEGFLSGMSTLMMKLGPGLIGKGRKKLLDRLGSRSFGAVTLRMRVRDVATMQADILAEQLARGKGAGLCFINIAGGAATDSINALITLVKRHPVLLHGRAIEINVLDLDSFGPDFANSCIESLKGPEGPFHGLSVSFRHLPYDWNGTGTLAGLLQERAEWIKICSSEGGLFEYATDTAIRDNLETLGRHSGSGMRIVGSLIRDAETVDPGILAALKITDIRARLLGMAALEKLLEGTGWEVERVLENNLRYQVFSLIELQGREKS